MPHDPETRRATPRILPDLIASGDREGSEVLIRVTRWHANVLGAYLNGRNDIARLPEPVREILDALTMRLVGPPGSKRWADLRTALNGQPVIERPEHWDGGIVGAPVYHRPRRPYDGGPNGEDVLLGESLHDERRRTGAEALLGDADGTPADWQPLSQPHLDRSEEQ